jgi:hypothetical protein
VQIWLKSSPEYRLPQRGPALNYHCTVDIGEYIVFHALAFNYGYYGPIDHIYYKGHIIHYYARISGSLLLCPVYCILELSHLIGIQVDIILLQSLQAMAAKL